MSAGIASRTPTTTRNWLLSEENPAVAALTRWELLGESRSRALETLWARRNEYAPVARILDLMAEDGSSRSRSKLVAEQKLYAGVEMPAFCL